MICVTKTQKQSQSSSILLVLWISGLAGRGFFCSSINCVRPTYLSGSRPYGNRSNVRRHSLHRLNMRGRLNKRQTVKTPSLLASSFRMPLVSGVGNRPPKKPHHNTTLMQLSENYVLVSTNHQLGIASRAATATLAPQRCAVFSGTSASAPVAAALTAISRRQRSHSRSHFSIGRQCAYLRSRFSFSRPRGFLPGSATVRACVVDHMEQAIVAHICVARSGI